MPTKSYTLADGSTVTVTATENGVPFNEGMQALTKAIKARVAVRDGSGTGGASGFPGTGEAIGLTWSRSGDVVTYSFNKGAIALFNWYYYDNAGSNETNCSEIIYPTTNSQSLYLRDGNNDRVELAYILCFNGANSPIIDIVDINS